MMTPASTVSSIPIALLGTEPPFNPTRSTPARAAQVAEMT